MADFELEPHHVLLLSAAAEAIDRCQQAREMIAAEGITVRTADGGAKAHPAIAIERDSRLAFARLLRELDLDVSAPAENARPPALRSNRRGA
jgi:P27 family predicted phage terminase small subunit